MCGIAGFIADEHTRETAERMALALEHRGPDHRGVWVDDAAGVGLAHARLAILDLTPAGHQPMASPGGRFIITYNGEIYNHLDLRRELERGGFSAAWRGQSDTETLLAGIEAWGIRATLERTVGMFALAVWDRDQRRLTLARDRLGEKPLYYGWNGDVFLFGSELKAVRQHPGAPDEIDERAVAAFLRFGYVPSPLCILRGMRKLPPGSLLHVKPRAREATVERYWSVPDAARAGLRQPFEGSDAAAIAALDALLLESVRLQQIADVPLGALLSGGVDSSLIVALMQANNRGTVRSFTIGTEGAPYDEAVYAREIANHLGTTHTELYVTAEEARSVILRLATVYDEPFADSSQIPTILVSQLARDSVTVALSGDGGDELFGGYNRYMHAVRYHRWPRFGKRLLAGALELLSADQWDRLHRALRPVLPRALQSSLPGEHARKLGTILGLETEARVYEALVSTWQTVPTTSGAFEANLVEEWNRLADLDSPEHRMMALDAMTYMTDDVLCKVDRAAMSVSLETRVPLLDHRVVEFAWRLPLRMKFRNGRGKWILRELLAKYVPRRLFDRPKTGFGIPIGIWLRGPLRDWAEELLSESSLRNDHYLDAEAIRRVWRDHLNGRNRQHQIWNVLMFQAWRREHVHTPTIAGLTTVASGP